jgi:hypothetical protein
MNQPLTRQSPSTDDHAINLTHELYSYVLDNIFSTFDKNKQNTKELPAKEAFDKIFKYCQQFDNYYHVSKYLQVCAKAYIKRTIHENLLDWTYDYDQEERQRSYYRARMLCYTLSILKKVFNEANHILGHLRNMQNQKSDVIIAQQFYIKLQAYYQKLLYPNQDLDDASPWKTIEQELKTGLFDNLKYAINFCLKIEEIDQAIEAEIESMIKNICKDFIPVDLSKLHFDGQVAKNYISLRTSKSKHYDLFKLLALLLPHFEKINNYAHDKGLCTEFSNRSSYLSLLPQDVREVQFNILNIGFFRLPINPKNFRPNATTSESELSGTLNFDP